MGEARIPYATRVTAGSLEVREAETDGRTIFGTVVPYGEVATVNDGAGPYRERFAPGAFTRSIEQAGDKVPLYPQHNRRDLPITRGADWDDSDKGLTAAFTLPRTSMGDDVLTLVSEGIVDSFSVGFRGIKAVQDGDTTVRTEAALSEVSLVAEPAYKTATVSGIRALLDEHPDTEEIEEWLTSLPEHTRALIARAMGDPADGTVTTPPDEAAPPERHGPETTPLLAARHRVRDFKIEERNT